MTLTEPRPPPASSKFPTIQIIILAICRIAEPIALTSVLPYAFPMVKWLKVGDGHSDAFYAGALISAFSLAEAMTGMFWGGLSDRVGRKPILILGCAGTLLSMIMFGLATNYWFALLARCVGGLLNGNIGVIQTMVGELIVNPAHEARGYAVMPFVWSLGTILGPMIAGLTANSPLFPDFPYLVPNLICAGLLLVSIVVGYFFLEETLKPHEPADPARPSANTEASENQGPFAAALASETPLMNNSGAMEGADLRGESYGTFNRVDIHRDEDWRVNSDGSSRPPSLRSQTPLDKVFTRKVVACVAALGIFCYHAMVFDSLLPIFLQDDRAAPSISSSFAALADLSAAAERTGSPLSGGLGMSVKQVGIICSVNGVLAMFAQGVVFPLAAEWLGVWRLFQVVTLGHPVVYFLVPYLAVLGPGALYPALYALLALRNFFAILAYPLVLILIKEACEPRHLGKVNGLGASAGAVARCLAPPLSGVLYGIGADVGFTGLAWFAGGLVAIAGAVEMFWIHREKSATATVRLPCAGPLRPGNAEGKEVVHILVNDV